MHQVKALGEIWAHLNAARTVWALTRSRTLQENAPAPAPRRTGRKRGAPAPALETVAEDAELQEEEAQHREAEAHPAPGVPAQEVSAAADQAGKGKPPLPGRPRRGKAAKTVPPAGEHSMMRRA